MVGSAVRCVAVVVAVLVWSVATAQGRSVGAAEHVAGIGVVPDIPLYEVSVAVTRGGVPVAEGVAVAFVDNETGVHHWLGPSGPGTLSGALPAGEYGVLISEAPGAEPDRFPGLIVGADSGNTFLFDLEQESVAEPDDEPADEDAYLVSAPGTIVARSNFEVTWSGAGEVFDYITIVEARAPEGSYGAWDYTSAGNPVVLAAPADPGSYEIRYVSGWSSATVASQAVTVIAANIGVSGPQSVARGADFTVRVTGLPGRPDAWAEWPDWVTIVTAGADDGSYLSYAYMSSARWSGDVATVVITAPDRPGLYELRYVTAYYEVLVRTPITVH